MAYFDHAMTTDKFFNKNFGKGKLEPWISTEEWNDTFKMI